MRLEPMLALVLLTAACGEDHDPVQTCWRDEVRRIRCPPVSAGAEFTSGVLVDRDESLSLTPGVDLDCESSVPSSPGPCGTVDEQWVYGDGVDTMLGDALAAFPSLGVEPALHDAFASGEYTVSATLRAGDGRGLCAEASLRGMGFIPGISVRASAVGVAHGRLVVAEFDRVTIALPTAFETVNVTMEPAVLQGRVSDGEWQDVVLGGVIHEEEAAKVFAQDPSMDVERGVFAVREFADLDMDGDGVCESISASFLLSDPEP